PALILMSFWGVGQAVVIYLAAMQDVPESLYEAAELDGVSPWGRFIHVTVPMISPMILFTVITAIIGAWQVFAVPYIMTGGGPDRATYFYTMYLYDKAFLLGPEMGYASAMAWIQLLIIMFFTALVFLASRRLVFYRAG
ncbi:MAG: sugar ABC transporter permease, partial [Phycisphaerales bacterium]